MASQRGLILFATAKAKRWGEEAKGNALGGEACVCVHEPMLDTCVDTYMLYVIYMCCAACEFVWGYACVFWICMCVCCMFVCSEIVCLFSQRVYVFSFSHSTGSPSRGNPHLPGVWGGYPACPFFSHLPSAQKMIDDSLPFCKQLSPPGPIVRRPRLGDISKHHADRQAASLCSSPLSTLSSVG